MKGKGQGHSWPAERNCIFRPGVLMQPELRAISSPWWSLPFFLQIELQIFVREPRVANFFTRSPNYALFFFRARCVYSYAAPSPHSWPSAQVECIKFKHSLMKKIAHGVSRLYARETYDFFSLFSCLLCGYAHARSNHSHVHGLLQICGTHNNFYDLYNISVLTKK